MSLFTSAGQLYEFWYLKKRICTLHLKPLLESSDVFSVLHMLSYVTLALYFCLHFVLKTFHKSSPVQFLITECLINCFNVAICDVHESL